MPCCPKQQHNGGYSALVQNSRSVSGCKEWAVRGRGQGCPILPDTVTGLCGSLEGGRQLHKDEPVCPDAQNLSVIVGDTQRERRDGRWGQRRGDVTLSLFYLAGTSGMSSERDEHRSSREADSDASGKRRTVGRVGTSSAGNNTWEQGLFVWATMGSFHVRMFSFRIDQ